MDTKRPFAPRFIASLDEQLLKKSPVTWSSRIHLVLYYGVAVILILFILCFIVPDDPRSDFTIHHWVILTSIVSLLAFICWMIYLLRFNVFKRFGRWNNMDTIKSFLLYFFNILIIISWPYIPTIVQSIRANAAYTSEELANDINAMNIRLCQLEQDSISTRFSRDTFELKNSVKGTELQYRERTREDENYLPDPYFYIDSATLHSKLQIADSINKINDSLYVIYSCPNYNFIYESYVEDHSEVGILKSIDLYKLILQNKQIHNTDTIKKDLADLFIKYSPGHSPRSLSRNIMRPFYSNNDSHFERISAKYDLYFINSSISNIADKKYRWDIYAIKNAFRIAYYIAFCLALVILIYRHTTRKTFFLSLLTAVILSILTGIFIAMSHSGSDFPTWVILYFVIFCTLTFIITGAKNRNAITGIGLNLMVFLTPFMPLVITSMYYSILRRKYDYYADWEKHLHLFKNESFHYFLSEIAGFIIVVLLLSTFYRKIYKKWFALPEQ